MLNYLINYLKTSFRSEMVNFIFKILAGIILTSVIIFSLFELAFSYQKYLAGYIYGTQISILSFVLIAAISFGLFLFLFNKSIKFATLESQKIHDPFPLMRQDFLYTISIKAAEGFISGLLSQNQKYKNLNDE
jgi:hypothetical protein